MVQTTDISSKNGRRKRPFFIPVTQTANGFPQFVTPFNTMARSFARIAAGNFFVTKFTCWQSLPNHRRFACCV